MLEVGGGFAMGSKRQIHHDKSIWPPQADKLAGLRADTIDAFMSGDMERYALCNVALRDWLNANGMAPKPRNMESQIAGLRKHFERKRREKAERT